MGAQRNIPLCLCVLACSGFFLAGIPATKAHAQSNDVLNRLKRIENEVDTLNRAVYKGEKRPPVSQEAVDASANAELRLNRVEEELRNITGKLEQQAYDNQQLQQRLEALEQDSRMRLDTLEAQARAGAVPAQPAPAQQQPMVDTNTVPPPGAMVDESGQPIPKVLQPESAVDASVSPAQASDAASLYESGFAQIKANDYDGAEKSFAKFMKDYPTHALAPNALYWLGETYYVRKNYDKASRTFAEAYQKFPNGPKAADNLLKLGMSLSAKGEKQNACIALGQLKKEYPNGPEPVLKRGADEMAALGCP